MSNKVIDILQMELDGMTPSPWLGRTPEEIRARHRALWLAKRREERDKLKPKDDDTGLDAEAEEG